MADVQKNVTMKDGTGEKPVGINLCILVFHSILESSKLLQTQDVFKSLKEKKENQFVNVLHDEPTEFLPWTWLQ